MQFQGSDHSTMRPSGSLKMIVFAWRISKVFSYDSLSAAAGMFKALSLSRSSPLILFPYAFVAQHLDFFQVKLHLHTFVKE